MAVLYNLSWRSWYLRGLRHRSDSMSWRHYYSVTLFHWISKRRNVQNLTPRFIASTENFVNLSWQCRHKGPNTISKIKWRWNYVTDWLLVPNHFENQKGLLLKQDLVRVSTWAICEQVDDVSKATAEHSVVHFSKTHARPSRNSLRWNHRSPAKKMAERETKPMNRCYLCDEFRLISTCWFRNIVRYSEGKTGHIREMCRQFKFSVTNTNDVAAEEDVIRVLTLNLLISSSQFM